MTAKVLTKLFICSIFKQHTLPNNDIMTAKELAAYGFASGGRILGFKVGGFWRFSKSEIDTCEIDTCEIDTWIEEQKKQRGAIK